MCDSLEKNREMLAHAEKVGCSHVLFGYPATYYPKTSEEIYKLTKEMCEISNLGIVMYPTPHFNFERISPAGFPIDVLNRIAELDNVVAIKVGEAGLIAECVRNFGDRVLVSCPIERWWPMLYVAYKQQWIGAGPYETMQSPENPYLVQYGKLMLDGKMDEAMGIFWRLTPARNIFEQEHMKVVMIGTYPWSLYKYYQWLVGGNGGLTRQPSLKNHQHQMDMARTALQMIGISPRENEEEFYVGRLNYEKMKK
jgi:4-hydroxy-tetrahydrodipicolinate synthase